MFVDSHQIDLISSENADNAERNNACVTHSSNVQAQTILAQLKLNKWYLDAEITLADVAQHMSLDPKLLSELINTELKQNFFEKSPPGKIAQKHLLGLLRILQRECAFGGGGGMCGGP